MESRMNDTFMSPCGQSTRFLLFLVLMMVPVDASITIMDTGKEFPSRPEKKFGHQLWKGSDYMGRLQFVHGNLQLCKSAQNPHKRFAISETMDGLPVAIYAKDGGCSLEEKAFVASTLLDPPNIVGYLIVDDDKSNRRNRRKTPSSSWFGFFSSKSDLTDEEEWFDDFIDRSFLAEESSIDTDEDFGVLWDELTAQVQKVPPLSFEMKTLAPLEMDGIVDDEPQIETAYLLEPLVTDDETPPPVTLDLIPEKWDVLAASEEDVVSASDDETRPLPLERFRIQAEENAWWSGGDEPQGDDSEALTESNRLLKHYGDKDRINVAIFHVTNRIGFDILDLLLKENSEVGRVGGFKLLLNSKEPYASASTILVWTMLSISVSACACCCMLVFVEFRREEERTAPQQPVRRRLTNNQVRESYPSFLYNPENHVDKPLEDECSICLDDFAEGMRLRKLPCGHVFHSTCVARWLIERSAVCPLCKMDLYEPEEEEQVEQDHPTGSPAAMISLTRRWFTPSRQAIPARTNIATPSRPMFSWFSTSLSTAPTGSAATAPPPARAFRFSFAQLPTSGDRAVQQNVASPGPVTMSTSPLAAAWASSTRWFSFPRRRGAEAESMLTELTEPLMPNGNRGDEEGPIAQQNQSPGAQQEAATSSSGAEQSAPLDDEAPNHESGPVEV